MTTLHCVSFSAKTHCWQAGLLQVLCNINLHRPHKRTCSGAHWLQSFLPIGANFARFPVLPKTGTDVCWPQVRLYRKITWGFAFACAKRFECYALTLGIHVDRESCRLCALQDCVTFAKSIMSFLVVVCKVSVPVSSIDDVAKNKMAFGFLKETIVEDILQDTEKGSLKVSSDGLSPTGFLSLSSTMIALLPWMV